MKCPKCGSTASFDIEVTTIATMIEENGEQMWSGHIHSSINLDYDSSSSCECNNCYHSGIVLDFEQAETPDLTKQIADILWPEGDAPHEWSPDTLEEISELYVEQRPELIREYPNQFVSEPDD
jgi:hypothetical protein